MTLSKAALALGVGAGILWILQGHKKPLPAAVIGDAHLVVAPDATEIQPTFLDQTGSTSYGFTGPTFNDFEDGDLNANFDVQIPAD